MNYVIDAWHAASVPLFPYVDTHVETRTPNVPWSPHRKGGSCALQKALSFDRPQRLTRWESSSADAAPMKATNKMHDTPTAAAENTRAHAMAPQPRSPPQSRRHVKTTAGSYTATFTTLPALLFDSKLVLLQVTTLIDSVDIPLRHCGPPPSHFGDGRKLTRKKWLRSKVPPQSAASPYEKRAGPTVCCNQFVAFR